MSQDHEYRPENEQQPPANWSSIGRDGGTADEEWPDERIREDACDRLVQFGPVDCTNIGVTVSGGVVTLDGTLPDRAMVDRVIEVIKSVAGVRSVESKLQTTAN